MPVVRFVTLVLCASGVAAHAQLLDRVVARVGGTAITLTDVRAARGLGIVEGVASEPSALAGLHQLIDRQLQLAEVRRFPPPEPSDEAIAKQIAAMRARAGPRLEALSQETGLDEARIRELARDTLRIEAYLDQRFGSTVQISTEEAREYFRARAAEFSRGGASPAFEEVESEVRRRASEERRRAIIANWLGDLRKRAEIMSATDAR